MSTNEIIKEFSKLAMEKLGAENAFYRIIEDNDAVRSKLTNDGFSWEKYHTEWGYRLKLLKDEFKIEG